MPKHLKTRRQLAKMISRRLRRSKVRVPTIAVNADGTWYAITVGDEAAIANAQPRIDAIVARLRESYEVDHSYTPVSGSAKLLNWIRRRGVRKPKALKPPS